LSVRGCSNFGTIVSVADVANIGSSLSVFDFLRTGSLSVRGFAQFGTRCSISGDTSHSSTASVLDVARLGSGLSVRGFGRIGRGMSLSGLAEFGSTVSMVDSVHLSSLLSVRSFVRLGSSLSVQDSVFVGSSISVHGGAIASSLSVDGSLEFSKAEFSVDQQQSLLEFSTGGQRSLALKANGGVLHGVWSSDLISMSSDRRLKQNIESLDRNLQSMQKPDQQDGQDTWFLRQLRPVAYQFKDGPDAKSMRYGFVAQELEQIFPNLVRDQNDYKYVVYQDVIALLTVTAQSFEDRLLKQEEIDKRQQQQIERLMDHASKVDTKLEKHAAAHERSNAADQRHDDKLIDLDKLVGSSAFKEWYRELLHPRKQHDVTSEISDRTSPVEEAE